MVLKCSVVLSERAFRRRCAASELLHVSALFGLYLTTLPLSLKMKNESSPLVVVAVGSTLFI